MLTAGLKQEIEDKIQECLAVFNLSFHVNIVYIENLKTKAADAVWISGKGRIRLNVKLLLKNKADFLNEIIPHEVGHLIQDWFYPKGTEEHGVEWRSIMKALGVPYSKYHSFDVSAVDSQYHRYVCNCTEHSIHSTKHTKIQEGKIELCALCNSRVIYFPRGDN